MEVTEPQTVVGVGRFALTGIQLFKTFSVVRLGLESFVEGIERAETIPWRGLK